MSFKLLNKRHISLLSVSLALVLSGCNVEPKSPKAHISACSGIDCPNPNPDPPKPEPPEPEPEPDPEPPPNLLMFESLEVIDKNVKFTWTDNSTDSNYVICKKIIAPQSNNCEVMHSTLQKTATMPIGHALAFAANEYFILKKMVDGTEYVSGSKSILISELDIFIDMFRPASNPDTTFLNREFGNTVSISKDGNRLAIGSFQSSVVTTYQYNTTNGWVLDGTITVDKVQYNEGTARVALSDDGNTMLITTLTKSLVYKFSGGAWNQDFNGGADGINNGSDLSGNGSRYAISSPNGVKILDKQGNSWSIISTLEVPTSVNNKDSLSVSISDNGKIIAVGYPKSSGASASTTAGQVFVYAENNGVWTVSNMLRLANPINGALFGTTVSLNGDGQRLAVGAKGKVLVYEPTANENSWNLISEIEPPVKNDEFGSMIKLNNNVLVVGNKSDESTGFGIILPENITYDKSGKRSGGAFVYEADNSSIWNMKYYLKAPSRKRSLRVGYGVTVSDNGKIVLGAPILGNTGDNGETSAVFMY